jgi:hypothetical protein
MACRFDDVCAHQQVGEVERGRLREVVADATDLCGEMDDLGRPVFGEHLLGSARHGQVELGAAGCGHRGPGCLEKCDDPAAEETCTAGDKHVAIVEG